MVASAKRVIPRDVRARVPASWWSAARSAVYSVGSRPIHFIHIGKTGGTALKRFVADREGHLGRPVVLHGHGFRLWDVPQGHPVIFVVRHPLSRFTSGFYSRYREGRPTHYMPWLRAEARAFQRFDTPDGLARALTDPSEDTRSAAFDAMNSIMHVSARLSYWLGGPTYLRSRASDILWIGRQETLEADLADLAPILEVSRIDLPADAVASHATPPEFERGLSPQAVANLELWYSSDLHMLQVCDGIRAKQTAGQS